METQHTQQRAPRTKVTFVAILAAFGMAASGLGATSVQAQDRCNTPDNALEDNTQLDDPSVGDFRRGECSIDTDAPSSAAIMAAVNSGSNTRLQTILEYGERVDCAECVIPIFNEMFTNDDAQSREFAAWWLRRRGAAAWIANLLIETVGGDTGNTLLPDTLTDEELRARAASALGEFLIPEALNPLSNALSDESALVRRSAVAALGRLNHPDSGTAIARALADDSDSSVRAEALRAVNTVNFFRNEGALVGALDDDAAANRREAALLVGHRRINSGTTPLVALLMTDSDDSVRSAAAWALGRIGSGTARSALTDARGVETSQQVLDAIRVAQQM